MRILPAALSALFASTALGSVVAGPADEEPLQTVIVTAQKRPESSQDVPLTITPLSADELSRGNISDLLQVADYVPGMVFSLGTG